VRFKVGIFAVGFQGSFYFAICIWGALALPILLESAILVHLHRLVVIGRLLDWLTTFVLRLHHYMVVGWEGDHQRQRSSVKLTCHHQTASDKSEEHEMCSHIRFARACVADVRRFASAVSS